MACLSSWIIRQLHGIEKRKHQPVLLPRLFVCARVGLHMHVHMCICVFVPMCTCTVRAVHLPRQACVEARSQYQWLWLTLLPPLNFLKHVPSWNQELAKRLDWVASEPLDSMQLSLPLLQQRNYQRMPPCLAFRWCRRSELRSSYLQNKCIASEPSLQPWFQFSFFFFNWKPLVRPVSPNSFFSLKIPVATEHFHSRLAFLRNNTNPCPISPLTCFPQCEDLVIQCSSSTGTYRHRRHLKQ